MGHDQYMPIGCHLGALHLSWGHYFRRVRDAQHIKRLLRLYHNPSLAAVPPTGWADFSLSTKCTTGGLSTCHGQPECYAVELQSPLFILLGTAGFTETPLIYCGHLLLL